MGFRILGLGAGVLGYLLASRQMLLLLSGIKQWLKRQHLLYWIQGYLAWILDTGYRAHKKTATPLGSP